MELLTKKQRETLRTVKSMQQRNGITPTLRELEVVLGVTRNAVRARLRSLMLHGYVRLLPKRARGIIVIQRNGD